MRVAMKLVAAAAALCCGMANAALESSQSAEPPPVRYESGQLVIESRHGNFQLAGESKRVDGTTKAVINPSALSGVWNNPQQEGHGFMLTVNQSGLVVATWFVYANGRQVWIVANGPLVGNTAVLQGVITSSAQFPPAFAAAQVTRQSWGTITLEVLSCSSIRASWSPIVSGYSAGSLLLQPVVTADGSTCSVTGGGGGGGTDDHGNTFASATPVVIGGAISGTINPGNDIDVFSFTLGTSATVTARSVRSGTLDPIGALFDAAGNPLAEGDDSASGLDFEISRALSPGLYYLAVRSFGGTTGGYSLSLTASGGGGGSASVTLNFNNRLILPVDFTVGSTVIRVGAESVVTRTLAVTNPLNVSYRLVGATTNTGAAVGELQSGTYNPVNNPAGTVNFNLTNNIGGTLFFAPVIDNMSSASVLMGVNMGLQAENRCNCTAPPGQRTQFGYYRLFSNSNVRAYRLNSAYTGLYNYWGSDPAGNAGVISNFVRAEAGDVLLTLNTAP